MSIATTRGDAGQTSLAGGVRVSKAAIRVEAYGTVDELNAVLGLVRLHTGSDAALDPMLLRIQNDLFDLGAELCMPDGGKGPGGARLEINDAQVARLEQEIDTLNAALAPLRSFVLPGGSAAAAHLHLARTVCRRAERLMVELAGRESVGAAALRYVNRLSDFLFVAARFANARGKEDVLWKPGATR